MSPLPRLHHHDVMTVDVRTVPYNTLCNVGALKTVQCTASAVPHSRTVRT